MKNEKELAKELKELQGIHKSVKTLEVFTDMDSEETVTIYLKNPDKTTRSMVAKLVDNDKYESAIIACLKQLYIGGDKLDLITENDYAVESAGMGVTELLRIQRAVLKKN